MGLQQRTANTLAHKKSLRLAITQTAAFKIEPDAELPHEKCSKLSESNLKFKVTYERKRRVKDWSSRAYEEALTNFAVEDGWTDQEIANLIIAFRKKHGERVELREEYYRQIISKGRREHTRRGAMDSLNAECATTEAKLEIISTLIGLEISKIQRYLTDPPRYVLELGGQRTVQLRAADLLEQGNFRKALFDYGNHFMPVFKAEMWHRIVTRMNEAIQDVEVAPDGTHLGSATNWLASYVRDFLRRERVEEAQRQAILDRKPGLLDGAIWFSMSGLKKYVQMEFGENVSANDLAVRLQQIGCEFVECKTIRAGERRASRSLWKVSKELIEREELS